MYSNQNMQFQFYLNEVLRELVTEVVNVAYLNDQHTN